MKNMKRIVMIIMAVALVALPTMAQSFGQEDQLQTQFQSTSTLQGSGSTYSANPSLNADGTAYNPAESSSPAQAPRAGSGPRKSGLFPDAPNTSGQQGNVPVGDPVLPLLLFAGAYLAWSLFFRRKRAEER